MRYGFSGVKGGWRSHHEGSGKPRVEKFGYLSSILKREEILTMLRLSNSGGVAKMEECFRSTM